MKERQTYLFYAFSHQSARRKISERNLAAELH